MQTFGCTLHTAADSRVEAQSKITSFERIWQHMSASHPAVAVSCIFPRMGRARTYPMPLIQHTPVDVARPRVELVQAAPPDGTRSPRRRSVP